MLNRLPGLLSRQVFYVSKGRTIRRPAHSTFCSWSFSTRVRPTPKQPWSCLSSNSHASDCSSGIRPQARRHGSIAAVATASSPPFVKSSGPVLPLHERPVKETVTRETVRDWYKNAAAQAQAVGSSYEDADGGPSAEDLLTELNWLLDDAVDSVQAAAGKGWQPYTWRQLQTAAHLQDSSGAPEHSKQQVRLRADMNELMQLWRWRIQDRVPLQYLNNCCHWRDVTLAVGPGVLIPRPETELLIHLAEKAIQQNPELKHGTWLDVGTGSGAIAIGLAKLLPSNSQVVAIDKSLEAVKWAELNVQRLQLADQIQILQGSFYGPVMGMQGQIAGIVSNPPYIPSEQMNYLQAEVGQYEPWLALDGGAGVGLNSCIPVCQGAASLLKPGGFLALETSGGGQAVQLAEHLKSMPFTQVQISADMSDIRRFVTAVKEASAS